MTYGDIALAEPKKVCGCCDYYAPGIGSGAYCINPYQMYSPVEPDDPGCKHFVDRLDHEKYLEQMEDPRGYMGVSDG